MTDSTEITVIETALTTISDKFAEYAELALPAIAGVAVVGLGIWILPKIVRWLKKAF